MGNVVHTLYTTTKWDRRYFRLIKWADTARGRLWKGMQFAVIFWCLQNTQTRIGCSRHFCAPTQLKIEMESDSNKVPESVYEFIVKVSCDNSFYLGFRRTAIKLSYYYTVHMLSALRKNLRDDIIRNYSVNDSQAKGTIFIAFYNK